MRVSKTDSQAGSTRANEARGAARPIGGAGDKSFDSFLNDNKYRSMKERLKFLMEDIQNQGKLLADKPSLEDLILYKKMISQFMDISVKEIYKFGRDDYIDRGGRHHIYGLVRRVNSSLDSLTREVLDSQKDQLTILSFIDDIRGLLMDMML